MSDAITEACGELAAVLSQATTDDDPIIIGHVRKALELLRAHDRRRPVCAWCERPIEGEPRVVDGRPWHLRCALARSCVEAAE